MTHTHLCLNLQMILDEVLKHNTFLQIKCATLLKKSLVYIIRASFRVELINHKL